MGKLVVILWDHCSLNISSLKAIDKKSDTVLLPEIWEDVTYVKHHKKKLWFIYTVYRNFVKELENQGYKTKHLSLEAKKNRSLTEVVMDYEKDYEEIFVTEPSEFRTQEHIEKLKTRLKSKLKILEDDRFFCSTENFKKWVIDKKSPRMEYFYRKMRVDNSILLNKDDSPVGGKWNYDKSNRNPIKDKIEIPERPNFKLDNNANEVREFIEDKFKENFGDLTDLDFPTTRKNAEKWLDFFLDNCLEKFGCYQDAMQVDGHYLFHSIISMLINIGLLEPKDVCIKAEKKYKEGKAPLESVEGFIRQILGWREFIRGVYFHKMPEYKNLNYFDAKLKLPNFYWTGDTKMNCISNVVKQTKQYAYSHHIQRLMVTGNFALLAGLNVKEVCEWYLIVYADAFDWVELPNTLGMALFGDGGYFASKPYAASGNYINKMSNFCASCHYNVKTNDQENSCPFNSLYWDFINRNKNKLENNQRLRFVYSTWNKMNEEKKSMILERSKNLIKNVEEL